MKPTDFIQFFDFTNSKVGGRGRALKENECSILLNKKNSTSYFRFGVQYSSFSHLKIGQSNGSIYFLLNKKNGMAGAVAKNAGTISFTSSDAVTSILTIIKPEHSKLKESIRLNFDLISSSDDEILFKFKDIVS